VTTPRSEGNPGIIVHSEVISLWMHPALFDLAQRPEHVAACRSLTGFRRYAEEKGLENSWYLITAKALQVNGETIILNTIRRPYEMVEPLYSEFPAMLAIAAGKPPPAPFIDFASAKLGVIPSRFLEADPGAILDELRTLELCPDRETVP
jgi:hypothetical protein